MEIASILGLVLNTAMKILDNKDLIDSVLSSDELTPEAKERIRKWRRDVEAEWDELLPPDLK